MEPRLAIPGLAIPGQAIPGLAIIVPTFRRQVAAAAVIDSLYRALGPNDAVVVVDQSCARDHLRLATAVGAFGDRRLIVVHDEKPGLPAARNHGVALTTQEIVLFFDDDVVVGPGCLDAHRSAYGDPTVGGVGGRIVERVLRPNAPRTVNRVSRTGRVLTRLEGAYPTDLDTLKGANMSFRRTALEQAGPFDPGYAGTALLEDADLSERVRSLGWRLRFSPEAVVVHHHFAAGGVRQDSTAQTLFWRFHNTGRFVGLHRSRRDIPLVLAAHAAIAVQHGVGDPAGAARSMWGLVRGLTEGRRDRLGSDGL